MCAVAANVMTYPPGSCEKRRDPRVGGLVAGIERLANLVPRLAPGASRRNRGTR